MITSELYPVFSGGMGRAVYEIANSLGKRGVGVTVLIPQLGWKGDLNRNVKVVEVPFRLAYGVYDISWDEYYYDLERRDEVMKFNRIFKKVAEGIDFDVIHVHDWMNIPAGILIRRSTGKPLVVHIHSTEYDRTNDNPRPWVVDLEREGMQEADAVVVTSRYTKQQLVSRYGIDPSKIHVAYNGINPARFNRKIGGVKKPGDKVVLFVGRLTVQKGLWHLLQAAREVILRDPSVRFVIIGSGPDMVHLINLSIDLGIADKVIFTGRIPDEELLAAYRVADVFVMPSVSEPFGIVALEAMAAGKPVIVSKSSGVAEVVHNCFKVDFWDIELMASRILEVLHYKPLAEVMGHNGKREVMHLGWDNTASKVLKVYRRLL